MASDGPLKSECSPASSTGVVWRPVFAIRGRYYLHRLSNIFASPAVRRQRNLEWLEGLSSVGANPFDITVTYNTWAGEFFLPIHSTLPAPSPPLFAVALCLARRLRRCRRAR